MADLEPYHITRLQLVSRKLQRFCLDDELWKRHCFDDSPWYRTLQQRRDLHHAVHDLKESSPVLDDSSSETTATYKDKAVPSTPPVGTRHTRKVQYMANWDPVYPGESVSWYDEYIQRNGPASVSWLQIPRIQDKGLEVFIEARGVATYSPYGGNDGSGTMLAVSPLDDGSVCLWDLKGTRCRQGGILAKSKRDILFIDGPGGQNSRRSKRIDTGVTECVSVNHDSHRAFFAVQSRRFNSTLT